MSLDINLIGEKFKKLTVISKHCVSKLGAISWLCQCDCGKQIIATSCKLRKKDIRSCGCLRYGEDLVGKKFNNLLVISKAGKSNKKWLCQCECGKQIIISNFRLHNKKNKSCKCPKDTKHCKKCDVIYKTNYFFKNVTSRDGLSCYCKNCTTEITKKNDKAMRLRKNKQNCKSCNYILLTYRRSGLCLNCYQSNKKTRRKLLECKNRESLEYRLKNNISRSIREALSIQGITKGRRTIAKYLPYTMNQLKVHIENLFESWMTWENQGNYRKQDWDDNDKSTWKWQIDHIKPHSFFKYTSMEDLVFQQCWALSNLRPLSAKQNLSDGNRRYGKK